MPGGTVSFERSVKGYMMFNIKFKILADMVEELRGVSKEEFDQEYEDIDGQFELNVGSSKIGYVHDDASFNNEYLIYWFDMLVQSAIYLKESSYSIFVVLDLDNIWLEFNSKDKNIIINEKNATIENVDFLISNKKQTIFKVSKDVEWIKLKVNKEDFFCEIINKCQQFIDDVKSISSTLLETEAIKELCAKLEKLKIM